MNLKHRHPPDILQNLTRKCFQGVGEFVVLNLHYGGEFEKGWECESKPLFYVN